VSRARRSLRKVITLSLARAAAAHLASEEQVARLNHLSPAAGERHGEKNMASIDR
jgi:hypothetical protein